MIVKNLTPDEAVELMCIRDLMDEARSRMRPILSKVYAESRLSDNYKLTNVIPQLNMAIAELDMGMRGQTTPGGV